MAQSAWLGILFKISVLFVIYLPYCELCDKDAMLTRDLVLEKLGCAVPTKFLPTKDLPKKIVWLVYMKFFVTSSDSK